MLIVKAEIKSGQNCEALYKKIQPSEAVNVLILHIEHNIITLFCFLCIYRCKLCKFDEIMYSVFMTKIMIQFFVYIVLYIDLYNIVPPNII